MKKPAHSTGMAIPTIGQIEAYAMIVDLNGFTGMVRAAESVGDIIAQFTRDTLDGAIQGIEAEGGEVVGFMGDAILGILPDGGSTVGSCFRIAKKLDGLCEYISTNQARCKHLWAFAPEGRR